MGAFRVITTLIMTAGFGFFGAAKIVGASIVTDSDSWPRLSTTLWTAIGLIEVAAVAALLIALHPRFRTLGLAAAAGLTVLTVCAAVFHVVNSDPVGDVAPAVVQGLVRSQLLGGRAGFDQLILSVRVSRRRR